ncbi:hypothetical protein NQ315_003357 [Exocentrus adspersus]|uniref:Phospholipase A2-like domain-containing protein n=1 Tax=Exocentrus adspersus TaxID=1586481 RepID=A0AAV8V782_9CUCU|nr:hypothetical protein NQ315_013571 [Exocentrus adspersus]KAJ8911095.1 hypothetical protein NQ315_003357 [Exocentrus adspersus]
MLLHETKLINRRLKRVKKGSGVINTLINKLPFELHIPGYQYCGPGTKLAKRLARGDPGINKLDQSCREHDIAYNQSSNLEDRHKADYRLEQQAWERVKSKDASLGEKSAAWAITNTMKAKRKLGMGLNKKPKGRALGALGGGAAGIAKAVNDAKASNQQLAEQQRHNLTMEKAATGKGLSFRRNKKGKDENSDYVVGMCDFEAFNVIPNVDETCNQFTFENIVITIPVGTYEVKDINDYIQQNIPISPFIQIKIYANRNTQKIIIDTTVDIDFTTDKSIGGLLGFKKRILSANSVHESDLSVQLVKVNSLIIECNIAAGSYDNNHPVHTIHQFFPTDGFGYKIVETPRNIIYFPVTVETITNITVKVLDQDRRLVNFRGEAVTVLLHLKKS